MSNLLPYRQEVYRKIFHTSSSLIAILLWYYGKNVLLKWVLLVAILFPIFDYLRISIPLLKKLYNNFFSIITRIDEFEGLSGASWVFLGAGITVLLFSEKVAVIALLVMSLSDSSAAIIGIKYGSTKLFNKSLEGSLAFFITTYIIIFFLSSASVILTLVSAFCITIIELFNSPKLNDNILIPITTAIILSMGGIY